MTDRVTVLLLAKRLEREGKNGTTPISAELLLAANTLIALQTKLDDYEGTVPLVDPNDPSP